MTSGNSILDKNLDAIAVYNPILKEKLLKLPSSDSDIRLVETTLGETNLVYKGLPLHSQNGAESEANKMFEDSDDSVVSIHCILGIGLGYVFNEFCNKSLGSVILYETNLEILKATLGLVDFSKELSKPNVCLVSDSNELKSIMHKLYKYKYAVKFSILDSYKILYGASAQKMLDEINMFSGSLFVDIKTMKEKAFDYLESLANNFNYCLDAVPLHKVQDFYKDKAALVVSAGPTLDLNIETIKKNRDKFIIFCVGTALKALISNGIKPDFLNILELFDCSSQIKDVDLSDIIMILDPTSNSAFYRAETKNKFLFPQRGSFGGEYWGSLFGVNTLPYIAKGTVSYQALASAKLLGCTKLVLVGQDLAFVNNSCYSKSSAYSELVFEFDKANGKYEVKARDYDKFLASLAPEGMDIHDKWCVDFAQEKLRLLNESLYSVKGIDGTMIPTEVGYAIFIEHFKDFARENSHLDLINTSLIGAQLDGFKNVALEDVVKSLDRIESVPLETDFKFNRENILNKLKVDLSMLKEIFVQVKNTTIFIEKEVNDRSSSSDEDIYSDLVEMYQNLADKYLHTNKMYQMASYSEFVELQYLFKRYENSDTQEKIQIILPCLKEYFYCVKDKLNKIILMLENIFDN